MENPGKDRKASGGYGETYENGEWRPNVSGDLVEQPTTDSRFEIPRLQEREPEIITHTPSIGEIFPNGFDNEEDGEDSEETPPTEEIVPPRNRFN